MRVARDRNAGSELPAPAFPDVPELAEPFASAMVGIVAEVRRRSADVQTFTATLLRRLASPDAGDNVRLFLGDDAGPDGRARVAQTLLAGARIPAAVMQTLPLADEGGRVEIVPWLAVHNGQRWLYFDPSTGEEGRPGSALIWSWEASPLVTVASAS